MTRDRTTDGFHVPEPQRITPDTFCVEAVSSSVCGWGENIDTGTVARVVFVTLHGGPPLAYGPRPSADLHLVLTEPAADLLAQLLDHGDHWDCYERTAQNGD